MSTKFAFAKLYVKRFIKLDDGNVVQIRRLSSKDGATYAAVWGRVEMNRRTEWDQRTIANKLKSTGEVIMLGRREKGGKSTTG